ncbi:MAG: hypothetical protein REI78_02255 [Pedobacter sp.]|nr:hypothetical protein [Pedobacter sp.]
MKTDLVEIFQTIRANLQPYTANGFVNRINSDTAYDVWGTKEIDIKDKTRDVVRFASVEIATDHVLFCLTAIREEQELKNVIHKDLLSLLADDVCFHLTELDDPLVEKIADALVAGFTLFKQKGWV